MTLGAFTVAGADFTPESLVSPGGVWGVICPDRTLKEALPSNVNPYGP